MTNPRLQPEPREAAELDLQRGEAHPERLALRSAREATIERLSEAFARDVLTLEAFEQRVDQAFACRTTEDFEALVHDLGPARAPRALARVETAVVAQPTPPENIQSVALCVLGNVERRGRFSLPRVGRAVSVLGNVELDLRDVSFPLGVTELRVNAVLGNIEIIVPPNLAVETEGSGILGSFASLARTPLEPSGEPVLRVRGSAVFGNVEIRTLPRALLPRRV
ncbi:MAG: DUF1707 SHOCT-like domain-containing protein [Myxococcota bacterium]